MEHEHDGTPVDHTTMSDEELERCHREAELELKARKGDQKALAAIGGLITEYLSARGQYPAAGVAKLGRIAVEACPLEDPDDESLEDVIAKYSRE